MTKAFVVTLELIDGEDVLAAAAQDIFELLSEEFKVKQVNPWAVPEVPPVSTPDTLFQSEPPL